MNQFEVDPGWLRYVANPSLPDFKVPAGAVDAHCHVFGPASRFPFADNRKYTPCDAPKEDLFKLRDFLGFERNVIVQGACHGVDNSAIIDAIAAADGKARGIAVVRHDVAQEELAALHDAGIRGVRFNFVKRLADPRPDRDYLSLAERIGDLGWHVVLYFEAPDLAERYDLFSRFPVDVVVDHLGRPDVTKAVDGKEFGLLLQLMRENRNVYTKVTCPDRLSAEGPPRYADALPFARRVVQEFPERVLWGTDWPHPNMKSHMPDDGVIVDTIPAIAPTKAEQQALLVDNPMHLYWPTG